MLTPQGKIYLIDFSLVRIFNPFASRDSHSVGSTLFGSPEVVNLDIATDKRADIFSLGVTLLYLVVGGVDRGGMDRDRGRIRVAHVDGLQNIPKPLTILILKMIQPDRERRPSAIYEVKQELIAIQRELLGLPRAETSTKINPNMKANLEQRANNPVRVKEAPVQEPTSVQRNNRVEQPKREQTKQKAQQKKITQKLPDEEYRQRQEEEWRRRRALIEQENERRIQAKEKELSDLGETIKLVAKVGGMITFGFFFINSFFALFFGESWIFVFWVTGVIFFLSIVTVGYLLVQYFIKKKHLPVRGGAIKRSVLTKF